MKRKEKENQKQKLIPRKLKQNLSKNKTKPVEIRTKIDKGKKTPINKTHSMENISKKNKNIIRVKSGNPQKIVNNSMEELDYLNFSELDIDFYKKNSSFEEDIFNPKYYNKNNEEKNQIVQNRYNMIDTSFDTIKTENIITDGGNDYIEENKNILLKTSSTICNYYDKSEFGSDRKNSNDLNKNDDKKKLFKKFKNKSIQIYYNNINYPINSNRTINPKPPKTFSSSNIKLTQNNNNINNNKKNISQSKGNTAYNFMPHSKQIEKEDISSSILKKRNKENKTNIYNKIKNQNNLMKNYLKSNINKNSTNSNNNISKKKSFSSFISFIDFNKFCIFAFLLIKFEISLLYVKLQF